MANVTVVCFLASYAVACALEWTRFVRRLSINRILMLLFGAAGFAAHTIYLFVRSGKTNLPPLLSSTHDWLLVLAWLAILIYLFLTTLDRDLAVGVFLLPIVLILIVASYFVGGLETTVAPNDPNMLRDATRGWAMLHASLLVFGMGGVLLGFVLSMMYLVQHRRLKHQQTLQEGLTLPSLEKLARWNWWAVVVSVPLLTAGMIAGGILAFVSRKGPQPITLTDPVVIVNSVVIVAMLVFLGWLSRTHRPPGKQVAWLTLFAFGFLLVTLIGLQVLTGKGLLETGHA